MVGPSGTSSRRTLPGWRKRRRRRGGRRGTTGDVAVGAAWSACWFCLFVPLVEEEEEEDEEEEASQILFLMRRPYMEIKTVFYEPLFVLPEEYALEEFHAFLRAGCARSVRTWESGVILRAPCFWQSWIFWLHYRDRYTEQHCAEVRCDPTGAVLGSVRDAPVVVQRQARHGPDSAENCLEVPQVQYLAVVDVAVISQRQSRLCWEVPQIGSSTRCSRSEMRVWPQFAAFFVLRPAGRECPFFSPR